MIQDLKFAVRQLFKAPGFTIAAVIVLALGIGANTAVFSLVHTLFLAPPAYAKPNELVQVFSQDKKNPKTYRGFSYPTYRDIREQNSVFTDVMAYNFAMVGIGQKGDTRRTFAAIVSANYFSVLGVPLAQGRAFLPEEETPGRSAQVAIVSYSYWQDIIAIRHAWLDNPHQRPALHHRRRRAARIHRHDADFLAGSLAAAQCLRCGRKMISRSEDKETVSAIAHGQQLSSLGGSNPA